MLYCINFISSVKIHDLGKEESSFEENKFCKMCKGKKRITWKTWGRNVEMNYVHYLVVITLMKTFLGTLGKHSTFQGLQKGLGDFANYMRFNWTLFWHQIRYVVNWKVSKIKFLILNLTFDIFKFIK